ncbi:MAG: hypothetical protein A2020_07440 [Lentisphaerae bacterium GWF2_45_14]|nr:MAG: hypothetical protein A2020_07440 [Lentisphaerae bacterium GWF2_45_14]
MPLSGKVRKIKNLDFMFLVRKIREKGFAHVLKRIWQEITFQEMKYSSVIVEITSFCNLSCLGCSRTVKTALGEWTNSHMSLENFKKLLNILSPAFNINLQGVGEPTLNPDFPQMISLAHKKGKFREITFFTNLLVRDADYYSKLFDYGLTQFMVSVDSIDQNIIDDLRKGTDVEDLKNRLYNISRKIPSSKYAINIVVGKRNIESIEETLQFLSSLGNLNVMLIPFDDVGNSLYCLTLKEKIHFFEHMAVIADKYSNLRISFNSFIPTRGPCTNVSATLSISVDGFLVPCCRVWNKSFYGKLNLFEADASAIFYSEKIKKIQDSFNHSYASFCDGCPFYIIPASKGKVF